MKGFFDVPSFLLPSFLGIVLLLTAASVNAKPDDPLVGAWHATNGHTQQVFVFTDNYFSHSIFDLENKKFILTRGGPYSRLGDSILIDFQYDSNNKAHVGSSHVYLAQIMGTEMALMLENNEKVLAKQIDDSHAPLAGVWHISARKEGESVNPFPLADRRTLKILTGTTFQWVAINIKTGEFSGTGGGTYHFGNGKYTEHIQFFSKDSSRVGASLTFDGKIVEGKWQHTGLSSAGKPIYEEWSRLSNAKR